MANNGKKVKESFQESGSGIKDAIKWIGSQFPSEDKEEEEPEEEQDDMPKKKLTYKEKLSKIKPFGK